MDPEDHNAADELGLRPIHVACLEGDFEAVVALAAEDGVVDALTEPQTGADWRLRETPIKFAALMGHLSIVEFLIERGASLVHENVRDDTHASSYAREEGLAEQRRDFYLNTIQVGREDLDAVNAREVIHGLLSSPGRRSVLNAMRGPRADLGFVDYRLGKQGRHIVVYAPVYRIKTDITLYSKKTVGVITTKGQGDVLMAAHSGFRRGADHDEKCLDTAKWNYIALHHIAALIKFKFPGNLYDNGSRAVEDDAQRGRAHAGHVEILLASWYALEMARRVTGGDRDVPVEQLLPRLRRVRTATTLGAARCAVIMIDHQPCLTCLKFINRLYQKTGVHFSVQGSVGVGPTVVTKDPRNNLRLDTFGDVFPVEEGEDTDVGDVEDVVVPETPAAALARNQNAADASHIRVSIENPAHNNLPAQAASTSTSTPLPLPWTTAPRRARSSSGSDSGIDDISYAARVVMEQIARPNPTNPLATPMLARARMAWPLADSASHQRGGGRRRRRRREDPFGGNMPSRVPENHLELVADYKKKTPVWQWPGYEAVARMRSEDLRRRLAEAQGTPCPGGEGMPDVVEDVDEGIGEGIAEFIGEDTGYDMGFDLDVGAGVGDQDMGAAAGSSDEDMIIVNPPDDSDDAAAYSPGNSHSPAHLSLMSKMNSQADGHEEDPDDSPLKNPKVFLYSSFVPMPRSNMQGNHAVNDNGDMGALEDDFYMIGPSQRARLGDCTMDENASEGVEMVSAHFPPAKPVSLSQFKYQPRARHGRTVGKGKAPEAPMLQHRPIPNFRDLRRLGR
ncbi:hypothetical protein GGR53DRAFT_525068 [Hypoxylon sp. FL1150]|nr:hypothetical protein GGR53DRAFT_525068 [Hypoxylon sp. FL1150]